MISRYLASSQDRQLMSYCLLVQMMMRSVQSQSIGLLSVDIR